MKIPRLLLTSTFRLSALYMAVFAIAAAMLLALIYRATTSFLTRQTDQAIEADFKDLMGHYDRGGIAGLSGLLDERSATDTASGALYLLIDRYQRPLAGNLGRWPEVTTTKGGWMRFAVEIAGAATVVRNAARAKVYRLAGNHALLVGRDIAQQVDFERRITGDLVISLAVLIGLGAIGGLITSRNMLRRVDAIARTTERIRKGDLSERLPLQGIGDEFDRVGFNVNRMLDRLEQLTEGMRTVIDSVAHDLRAPITRLRTQIEVSFGSAPDIETYRLALETALRETERLNHTVNALLHIAQAEAGALGTQMEALDLAELARDVMDLYQPLAEEKGLVIALEADAEARISGNRELLAHMIANLFDNAIKYTPAGGGIGITVYCAAERIGLTVSDSGPGIPEGDRERVLQRFVRLDTSRSSPGSGLGLSLVAAVAKLHQAELTLADNRPGLRVTLSFPQASPGG